MIYNSKKFLVFCFCLMILLYFIYHIIHGERGIVKMLQIKYELIEKQKVFEVLSAKKSALANKIKLLHLEGNSTDLLDEMTRDYFGKINEGEVLLVIRGKNE